MTRGPLNVSTGRTVDNCKAHPDGIQCPSCKSTMTKLRPLIYKKKMERLSGYTCLNSECNFKLWIEGETIHAPYNMQSRAMSNPVGADAAPQPPPPTAAVRRSQREPKMPRPRNEHTGRTVENLNANPDGIECPTCKSTETKFRFFNNKKVTQPRYQCLNSTCTKKLWTVGGTTRAPYNTRNRPRSNPVVVNAAPLPPPFPPTAVVRRPRSQQYVSRAT